MLTQHLYKTFLYKIEEQVADLPSGNSDNLDEFESNYKDTATAVDQVQTDADVVVKHDLTWSGFKSQVGILWSQVYFIETPEAYQLNYLVQTLL